ncbi:ribosomal protection-like ABC-F family protein [Jeotgalibacillus proteolyticus]|uniref:ABC transporter ATP-binding protein n=1 Tax=Jeotgalibacillus proteolyticus TaxID=2082395 RepID=A0A2S5G7B7_9BACL|nr:ABC-F type ribosomal protection protein [Jeotgalibacillus proteolyticus]PPA68870.1 ABC transporter ATP-binding protein [Jeotgalibacillus proteolyticus]
MIICQLYEVKKQYNEIPVFEGVSLVIKNNDRVGLVGRNGSGKSTLFKLITGEEEADAGSITLQKNCRVGILSQIPDFQEHKTGRAYLESAFEEIFTIQKRLRELEKGFTEAESEEKLNRRMIEYGALQEELEQKGGYEIESKIDSVITGLKIEHLENRELAQMSGGEKTKIGLSLLLLQKPDLLLLDEPTNHLDLESIEWLEQFLQQYKGAVIVISHDRYFLDHTVNKIADLEDGEITIYPCSYTAYVKQKEEKLMHEFHAYEEQQKKIKKMKEAIKRLRQWANESSPPSEKLFRKAKSMEKALAKIDVLKKPVLEQKTMNLSFQAGDRSGKDVLTIQEIEKGYQELLFKDLNLSLYYKDRMAIVGSNGSGKSTLFSMILGSNLPDKGQIKRGSSCKIGYLSQDALEFEPSDRVIDLFRRDVPVSEAEARHKLATFLFYGANVFNRISGLSGGERMRLRLAVLMHQPCNLLLLDEPTNHLDIESQEVLEEALTGFEGTILAISHDRYFLNNVFTRTAWLENRQLTLFEGPYDWAKEKRSAQKQEELNFPVQKSPKKRVRKIIQPISEEITEEDLLKKLEELEQSISSLEKQLNETTDLEETQQLYGKKTQLEEEYSRLYQRIS